MHVINDKITKFGDINIKDIKISKNDASELKLIFKNKKPNISFNKIHYKDKIQKNGITYLFSILN